ncbi:hypothetical protein [Marinobacter sp. JB05H06]|nr:hypothetical protein [Marinobacter sp. JB05H06]
MRRSAVLFMNLTLLLALPGMVAAQQSSPQQGQMQGPSAGQAQGQAQMQNQNQGQNQMRGQGRQPMAGSGLMTPEEQEQLQERIRSAGSQEERKAILDEQRLKMADRARAQGMNPESIEGLPSSSGDDPRSRQIRGQPSGAPQGPASAPGPGVGVNRNPATGTGRGPQQPVPGQQDRAGGVR